MSADDWRKLADWLFKVFPPADARKDLRAQVNAAKRNDIEGPPSDVLDRLENPRMTIPEINYDRIREAGDHVMPEPFRADRDTGQYPDGTTWIGLGHVAVGHRLEDARGQRFLLMGHGPMQGAAVLRDRNRRMFYADTDQRMRDLGPARTR